MLTFHVLEKDWKALPASTVVVISNMLTRDSSAPIPITSSVTTVTPVDIKKVYGLEQVPSVVRTETKSDMLEVNRAKTLLSIIKNLCIVIFDRGVAIIALAVAMVLRTVNIA